MPQRQQPSSDARQKEQRGFVTSRYEISEQPKLKGRATRVYTATDKVARVLSELKKQL